MIKSFLVEKHLLEKGQIDTWTAYKMYGITRIGAVIHRLRKKYNIESINTTKKNRYGRKVTFSTYKLEA